MPQVLERARRAGVTSMISIGTSVASSQRVIELSEQHQEVFATVGLHPHYAASAPDDLEVQLLALGRHPRVVAVGETGLDYYRDLSPRDAQRRVFETHVRVAQTLDLPLIIHCRDANDDVAAVLESARHSPVVMHCFTSGQEFARRCLNNGWWLAFGGAVTYPRNEELRQVVAEVPGDRLLFETDAPNMPPVPHRGQRNEPAYLPLTVARCAQARKVSAATLAVQAAHNARTVFRGLPYPESQGE
jgi:TatD DNase family protein